MSNFLVCLNSVAPIFLIMAFGFGVRCTGLISRDDVPKLNKLVFRCFMPVMLFYNIYTSDLSTAVQPKLIAFAAVSVLAVYALSLGYTLLTVRAPERRGVMIQGIYRSNFVIIGIPIAQQLMGANADLGPVVVLIAVVVPMFNVLAVVTLEVFNGKKPSFCHLLLDIIKNPLIIGTLAGLLALAAGLRFPKGIDDTLGQISAVTSPLLLFLLGVFFEFDGFRQNLRDISVVCLGRLVIVPALVLGLAAYMGFSGVAFAGLLGIFGSATAIASFTMAQQMGGDAPLAGDIVVATSALCPLTLFGWSLLFKSLGVF